MTNLKTPTAHSGVHMGLRGRFNIQRRCAKTLDLIAETGWFDNLITDQGLNWLGTGGGATVCMVGNSSAEPLVTQTGLNGFLAETSNVTNSVEGNSANAPWYAWIRRTYRFAEGAAAGNISEVGIGRAGNQCFSRALVRDPEGDPTTITVLSDEVLDVSYEFRIYASTTDSTFNAVVSGQTYACVLRPSAVGFWRALAFLVSGVTANNSNFSVYSGSIGSVTQGPSGNSASAPGGEFLPYSNNSLRRGIKLSVPLGSANLAGGIKSFQMSSAAGIFQMELTPNLMKDATKTMELNFGVSWARYVP